MPFKTLPDDKNFTDEVKRAILDELDSFVESYRIQNNITTRWKKPIIGFLFSFIHKILICTKYIIFYSYLQQTNYGRQDKRMNSQLHLFL